MILYRSGFLCAAAMLAALPTLSIAASFNCSKARSAAEILICGDPQLSAMDDDLAVLYRSAKAASIDAAAFKKETNKEWSGRENCQDRDCLIQWYRHRTSQLATGLNHAQERKISSAPMVASPVSKLPEPAAAPPPDNSPSVSGIIWFAGAVFGVLWFLQKVRDGKRRVAAGQAAAVRPIRPPENILTRKATSSRRRANIMQFEVRVSPGSQESMPKPAGKDLPTVWMRAGQSATVQGLSLPGGMLYVGNSLMAPDGGIEPAQIDPTLEVDPQPADPAERLFGYWARYDNISPAARRAYLTWLSGGRCDPNANIGNVFLFFYGLERRVLKDAPKDPAAKAEMPAIIAEIERLRLIYDNSSFLRYSSDLLDFLAADDVESELSLRPPPPSTASRGMSLRLRIGLGQAAVDARPVSAEWALAWVRSEPNVRLSMTDLFDGNEADSAHAF